LDEYEGVSATSDGTPIAIYRTASGDGIFMDNDGDEYGVDLANIGCIPMVAFDQDTAHRASELGHFVRFSRPFTCQWNDEGGFICFGDLVIKTDPLSHASSPFPLPASQMDSGVSGVEMYLMEGSDVQRLDTAAHIKLRTEPGMCIAELILRDEDDADGDSRLVMHEIAHYVSEYELYMYADLDDDDQRHLISILHLVFHSALPQFSEYFRGYYATPDNQIHERNLEEGLTRIDLNQLLDGIDWDKICDLCRRHCSIDVICRIFAAATGLNYATERNKYPVEKWDGHPAWPMVDRNYVASE
jgi:hypothetical protein